ncbi:MAG TPA: tannase/feruloyl esterase family alpha/beta hydrolase [Burkholderiaceae bacterium]|nr:tannase/feruloyl esterase family alpha/beta hydrolase [Burkholderiaceae bacterium]
MRDQPNGGAVFGIDPQARLDDGHNAVAQLTPMAHALIRTYYGRRADKSHLVGTSNGGRHGFVAAARDTGLQDGVPYDGVLSGTPGYNLPRAALAEVWGAQQFAAISRQDEKTQRPDLQTSFPPADLALVAAKITERCDALARYVPIPRWRATAAPATRKAPTVLHASALEPASSSQPNV